MMAYFYSTAHIMKKKQEVLGRTNCLLPSDTIWTAQKTTVPTGLQLLFVYSLQR
jgi:hypothetical protein